MSPEDEGAAWDRYRQQLQESRNRKANYNKLRGFCGGTAGRAKTNLEEFYDSLEELYKKHVVEFENTDDDYRKKAAQVYDACTSAEERRWDFAVKTAKFLNDINEGANAAVIDFVSGILGLAVMLAKIDLALRVAVVTVPFGTTPQWVKDTGKEAIEGVFGIAQILKNPGRTLAALGQKATDAVEEKGIPYVVSYTVTDLAIGRLVDMGIGKLRGLDKADDLSKISAKIDDVVDVADDLEGAAKVLDKIDDIEKVADKIDDVADVAKAVEKIDDVADAAKAVDKIDDVADVTKAIDKVDNVAGAGGLKESTVSANQYCLSGEEHFEAYKEMFGAENVEWTSRDTLSNADKLRIKDWKYPPTDEIYLKYKDVYQNDLYFNQVTGDIHWPGNNGFADYPDIITLQPGTIIDRYGSDFGTFTSPVGTPYGSRALAPGTELKPYSVFEVVKPIEVQAGKIAPWFNQPGGGMQYVLPDLIDELLDSEVKILRRLQ